jgi:uroporphyrinogen-III decarboxylase
MGMTSRERLLKAFRGEETDRVPVCLFMADQGHFLTQVYPELDQWDHEACQLKIVEFQRELGCDILLRCLYGINDPLTIHTGGLDTSQQTDAWQVETETIPRGTTTVYRSTIGTPEGTLTQDYSINEIRPGTFMYACTKKPIKTPEDLELAVKYEPRMPPYFPAKTRERVQRLKDALGDSGVIGSWTPHGPFNNASLLIDLNELYTLFLEDCEFYEKLMTFAAERILDYTRAMDEAGVDVHCVGGNVPGGFLGRRTYDRYILPFEKEYMAFVQQNGTPAMYHNCGEVMNLVESYKDLGAKIIEPFSPAPLGDADHEKAVELIDGAYVVIFGVDQVNVLQKGTVDDVKRVTERTIKTGKSGKQRYKLILQSADFLEYGTPIENLEAYVDTALQFAAY